MNLKGQQVYWQEVDCAIELFDFHKINMRPGDENKMVLVTTQGNAQQQTKKQPEHIHHASNKSSSSTMARPMVQVFPRTKHHASKHHASKNDHSY